MKTALKILVVLTLVFSFTSCEDDLADVTFNTKIIETFEVNAPNTNGEPEVLSASALLKLENGDGSMDTYINKVKDIKINKISYKIISFGDDSDHEALFTGSFNLDTDQIIEHADLNPYDAFSGGNIFAVNGIDIPESISSSNSQKMVSDKEIAVSLEGNMTTNIETNFTVEVTLELEITANPLD